MKTLTDFYICRGCISIQRVEDWNWKDRHYFFDLKETGLCEECNRKKGGKQK